MTIENVTLILIVCALFAGAANFWQQYKRIEELETRVWNLYHKKQVSTKL